jgi:hypothetical protein
MDSAGQAPERFHLLAYALGNHGCLRQIRIAQHNDGHDGLIAAEASQGIGTAGERLEGRTDTADNLVSDRVPVGIIDTLKEIDVDENQNCAPPEKLRVGQLTLERFLRFSRPVNPSVSARACSSLRWLQMESQMRLRPALSPRMKLKKTKKA